MTGLDHKRRARRIPQPHFAVGAVVLFFGSLCAASQVSAQAEGSTSKAARQEALRAIPYNELTPEAYEKLNPVLTRPSVYRRLPVQTFNCDADLHIFMVRYPEVIVSIWDMMGVTKIDARRTGDFTLATSDGEGTISNIELVYGTPELHIYYADGYYEGPLYPRRLDGRCVMVLRSEYGVDRAGNPVVRNHLDTFVKIDNLAADLVARTFHPMIGKSADHNFIETTKFLTKIHEAAETNSHGVHSMAMRLQNVEPEVVNRFSQISGYVEERATMRAMTNSTNQNTNRQIAAPASLRN